MTDPAALHQAMIDKVKANGSIKSAAVEAAMRAIPRHLFLPNVELERAYTDDAIPTKLLNEQVVSSSSQPTMMAIMLEQLELAPGMNVLEIGAGTGYNAALMAHIVGESGHITTVDIDDDIVQAAREHLHIAGYDMVQVICGDGALGYPPNAPYDRIILTVGANDIAPAWQKQLSPGGRLLLPLKISGAWMASLALEWHSDHWQSLSSQMCGFVPLRGEGAFAENNAVQIEIQPGLRLLTNSQTSVDTQALLDLLKGHHDDYTLSMLAPNFGQLDLWLSLRESAFCWLSGEDSLAALVPFLYGQRGKHHATMGLYDGHGLVLLKKDPEPPAGQEAYPLQLRVYHGGDSVAKRLAAHLATWEAAGRPGINQMHLMAYPTGTPYHPAPDAYVIDRPHTRLVISWIVSA